MKDVDSHVYFTFVCGCKPYVMGNNKMTDIVRLSIFLLIPALLFSCIANSNEKGNRQTQIYSTKDGDFIVSIDTLKINLKPYLSHDVKVGLTHAVKYGEKYYCYFTDINDSYKKYFFIISNNGLIEKEIRLPKNLSECYYLDLFVLNDTIFSKPYMNDKSYFLDLYTSTWIETSEPDDVIYADERFYVTYIDFGEWGSTTWFKDKISGKEYELASSGNIINRIDSSYYISEGISALKILNPLKMKQCDKKDYYQEYKKKKFGEGTNSLLGVESIFIDTTHSEWDCKEPNRYIATSFKVDNKLFYLCNDSGKTFIAKNENMKMIPIQYIGNKYSTFDWSYSYRCKIQKDNFQLLKFDTKVNNSSFALL